MSIDQSSSLPPRLPYRYAISVTWIVSAFSLVVNGTVTPPGFAMELCTGTRFSKVEADQVQSSVIEWACDVSLNLEDLVAGCA